MNRLSGFVERGGARAITSLLGSTSPFQGSYPLATVSVYRTGTSTLATLFSDNGTTPRPNPFTASSDGSYFFYTSEPLVDITFSGGGLATPYTLSSVFSLSPSSTVTLLTPTGGDDTAMILAAITAIPSTGAVLDFRGGTFRVGGSGALFTISKHKTKLLWTGTTFIVTPTGNCTVFTAQSSDAFPLNGFEIEGEAAFTSSDTTFTKTAISLVDTTGANVRFSSGPEGSWHDVGLTSFGIHIFGRDVGHLASSGGIAADRPVVISPNPRSGIDLDFWVFGGDEKLLLIANGHPNIDIGDCYVSNTDFRNISCNKGTKSIYHAGGVNPSACTNVSIKQVRAEQLTSATEYAVDWNATTRNLVIEQCSTGTPNKGYKIRNVSHLTLRHNEYNLGGGVALDFTTCDQVDLDNNFFIATSTFVTTGMVKIGTKSAYGSNPSPGAPFETWYSAANVNAAAGPISLLDEFRATFTGSLAGNNTATVSVPGLAGNAVRGKFLLIFTGAGDGAAEFAFTPSALYPIGGAANLPANIVVGIPGASQVGVLFNSQGNITIFNDYATPVTVTLSAQYRS